MPIILIGLIVLVGFWFVSIYNSLVTLRERVDNAKAQITTQIESRWDAIKSLIAATSKYSAHEAQVLEKVTQSRTSIGRGSSVKDMEKDQSELEAVVGKLIAVSEAYPDLKASLVYKDTMASINKFEDNVRNSRMIYNDVVTRYNRKLQVFPSSIVAGMFDFSSREYFEGTESKKDMPGWD